MSEPTRGTRVLQYGCLMVSALAFACSSATTGPGASMAPAPSGTVRPGIEVLLAGDMASLRGKRVGLITNHTGKLRDGTTTIDALHNDKRFQLVALFAPEHGIRGSALAGEVIDNSVDARTGLPVRSIYGATQKPTPAMLADLDVLVFDIQDIGSRFYTYPWSMILSMQAAAENGKRMVVLDRPNPIGGNMVQGNINDTLSFIGLYPVPNRHGLTVGEMALMINKEYKIGADLIVIPAEGLTRAMWFEDTGMPWTAPSPNMQSVEAATHYPGICLFEGTNLSTGRGTANGYEQIGAPWLDAAALIKRLESYKFPGVRFEATSFTPRNPADKKYDGVTISGVRFITTDRLKYEPTHVAIATLIEVKKQHPQQFAWGSSFKRLAGNMTVQQQINDGATMQQVVADWDRQVAQFMKTRAPYLIYK